MTSSVTRIDTELELSLSTEDLHEETCSRHHKDTQSVDDHIEAKWGGWMPGLRDGYHLGARAGRPRISSGSDGASWLADCAAVPITVCAKCCGVPRARTPVQH